MEVVIYVKDVVATRPLGCEARQYDSIGGKLSERKSRGDEL